jgi:hypothetical protein
VAVARDLLLALSDGQDEKAWEHAMALAKGVLSDEMNILANPVLECGPFAMRKAEELAELVLSGDAQGTRCMRPVLSSGSSTSQAGGDDADRIEMG